MQHCLSPVLLESSSSSLQDVFILLIISPQTLNGETIYCYLSLGALYAFPQIHLPPKAIEAAKAIGKSPDLLYCRELLDNTGMVIVPVRLSSLS